MMRCFSEKRKEIVMSEKNYVQELVDIIRSGLPENELVDRISDYHDNDIADALTKLDKEERVKVYYAMGAERMAEIFAYLDDAEDYLRELPMERGQGDFRNGLR